MTSRAFAPATGACLAINVTPAAITAAVANTRRSAHNVEDVLFINWSLYMGIRCGGRIRHGGQSRLDRCEQLQYTSKHMTFISAHRRATSLWLLATIVLVVLAT